MPFSLSNASTAFKANLVLSLTSPRSNDKMTPVLGSTPHDPEQKRREERGERIAGARKGAG
jgi:hypothetical protein